LPPPKKVKPGFVIPKTRLFEFLSTFAPKGFQLLESNAYKDRGMAQVNKFKGKQLRKRCLKESYSAFFVNQKMNL